MRRMVNHEARIRERMRVFDMVNAARKRALFEGALDIIDDATLSQWRFFVAGLLLGVASNVGLVGLIAWSLA